MYKYLHRRGPWPSECIGVSHHAAVPPRARHCHVETPRVGYEADFAFGWVGGVGVAWWGRGGIEEGRWVAVLRYRRAVGGRG